DADNNTRIINVTGGQAFGATAGVGASAAFTTVKNTTQAFIGDSVELFGPLTTGGIVGNVQAGNNLAISADSTHEIWNVAVAGSGQGSDIKGTGGEEQFQALQFGFGVSGDVAVNRVEETTEAFIRDVPDVQVGNDLSLTAHSDTFQAASAGATVTGNHLGIGGSFAHNTQEAPTPAFIQDVNLQNEQDTAALLARHVTIAATTDGTVLTFSNGGSGTPKGASVAGSVNRNNLTDTTEAFLGERVHLDATGNVVLQAT